MSNNIHMIRHPDQRADGHSASCAGWIFRMRFESGQLAFIPVDRSAAGKPFTLALCVSPPGSCRWLPP